MRNSKWKNACRIWVGGLGYKCVEIRKEKKKEAKRQRYLAQQKAKLEQYHVDKTNQLMDEEKEHHKKVLKEKLKQQKRNEVSEV